MAMADERFSKIKATEGDWRRLSLCDISEPRRPELLAVTNLWAETLQRRDCQ